MRRFLPLLALIFMPMPTFAQGAPCLSDPADIREVAQSFAYRTGTKFVLDPRVIAKVNAIGMDLDSIDLPTLISIFNIHGFEVIDSRGVLYVVPDLVADEARERLNRNEGQ